MLWRYVEIEVNDLSFHRFSFIPPVTATDSLWGCNETKSITVCSRNPWNGYAKPGFRTTALENDQVIIFTSVQSSIWQHCWVHTHREGHWWNLEHATYGLPYLDILTYNGTCLYSFFHYFKTSAIEKHHSAVQGTMQRKHNGQENISAYDKNKLGICGPRESCNQMNLDCQEQGSFPRKLQYAWLNMSHGKTALVRVEPLFLSLLQSAVRANLG